MRVLLLGLLSALSLASCSTVPREFSPVLAQPQQAGPDFDAAVENCTALVNSGVRSGFGDTVQTVGMGAAAGYGAGAVVFVSALDSSALGASDVTNVTLLAMPVIGILAGVAYSRHLRAGHEREIQAAMSTCLAENGYPVSDWELVR